MASDATLQELFLVWYDESRPLPERERAAREAVRALYPHLVLPARLRSIPGIDVEDLRQEVWRKLFDPGRRYLAGVPPDRIIAYARAVLQHHAVTVLRKRREILLGPIEASPPPDPAPPLDDPAPMLDFEHAARALERLDLEDRMAVLLTTCPSRIPEAEWAQLASGAPRPVDPLSNDEASRLLWPPREPEDGPARRRRLDRIRKRVERAFEEIRRP